MVRSGKFSAEIVVNGNPLKEWPHPQHPLAKPADAWVETDFHVPGVSYPVETIETDPYGEV